MRAIAIVLAITGALAVSGIAAPALAQSERHKCNPTGGPYPGYTGPYAYAAYYYGTRRIAEASAFTLHQHFMVTAIHRTEYRRNINATRSQIS